MFQKTPRLTPAEKRAGKAHMARVAQLPCVITGLKPVEVHHCFCGRFSGRKANDFQVIPLYILKHRIGPEAIHNNKRAWERANGMDYEYLDVVDEMLKGDV